MAICLRGSLSIAVLSVALLLAPERAGAEPQSGWWWNPNESGRGFFIEASGGVLYLAGYFYDTDGRATWLSSGGRVADPYSYSGTLQSYRGGQSVYGTYRPPEPAVDVGAVTVTFFDDTHGTLSWPGGTVRIERQIFGDLPDVAELVNPLAPAFHPKTGWWWNPAESGSGYSVEVQGDQAFVVAFMYDESGNPIWYFTAGPMSSPTHFEGDWLEFYGGQTLSGLYRPPATPRNLGRVTIDFAAFDDATITFTERAAAKRHARSARTPKSAKSAPRSRTSSATPQLPTPNWSDGDYWPFFKCLVGINTETRTTSETGLYTSDSFTYFRVLFRLLDGGPSYLVVGTDSYWSYEFNSTDTHNGCEAHGSTDNMTSLAGDLYISPDLHVAGRISDKFGGTELTVVTDSCQNVQEQPVPYITHVDGVVKLKYGNTIVNANPFPKTPAPEFRYVEAHKELDDGSEPDDPAAPLEKDGLRIKTVANCQGLATP
jgi:hypothetical protein